ncbi:phage terminase large subunit family protein [bacterium]|nr:phage terminase large subunit family protein [bacterium]
MSSYDTGAAQNEKRRRSTQDLASWKHYKRIVTRPEKLDRRLEAADSFQFFCEQYGSEAFGLAWSPAHLEVIEKIESSTLNSGSFALALPRGSGKSTLCHWAMIWALLNGHVEYALYVAADKGASSARLSSIKTTLRFNELLAEDYPEIILPIQWTGGEARKAGGQRFHETTTEIRFGSDKLIFPTLHEFENYAPWYKEVNPNFTGILDFASMESGLRGKAVERPDGRVIRPQLCVVDDPQTRESAASPAQVKKRLDILQGDIGFLGSPERPCGVLVPTTIVYEDDLSDQLMNHEKNPTFKGVRFGALDHMPWEEADTPDSEKKITDFWENEYREMRRFDLLDGTDHANTLYEANRWADGNTTALWEERKNKDEVSAIQNCMNLYLKDSAAFFAEFMNQPSPLETGMKPRLKPEDIIARQLEVPRNVVPAGMDFITVFADISMKCLWYSVVAFEKDTFRAHVLNAGVWPDQNKSYVNLGGVKKTIHARNPNLDYSAALIEGLNDFVNEILAVEYKDEGGRDIPVEAIGIDSGWGQEHDTVLQFSKRHIHSRMLYAMKGWGSTPLKKPLVDPEKKPDVPASLVGQWKMLPNRYGCTSIISDTNLWKSRVDNALRTPVSSRSALTVYGGRENGRLPNIQMFAEQMTSEEGILVEGGGRSIEQWKPVHVGRDNHLFDSTVGCFILANIRGAEIQTDVTSLKLQAAQNKKTKKRRRYVQG